MELRKRGQLGNLTPTIVTLVVAIIVLVLGLVIIQEIRDTDMLTQGETASYTNETLTTVTEAGENLACNSNPASVCSVSIATNATGGETIPSTNYSVSGCTLSVTSSLYNNTNWNATYSCTYGGAAYTSGNESLVGLGDFSDFVPIIVIAIAASLVIGLILIGFAYTTRRQR